MNNLKDFANDTVIKNLELEYKQYMELIPRLYDDLAAVKKAHKEALEFNYDLAEENTAVHTKVLAMQERIAELEAKLNALVIAVKALPVEEFIGTHNGEPYLIGYGMQVQGEWHDVLIAIEKAMKDE